MPHATFADRRIPRGGTLPDSALLTGEPYDEFRLFPVYLDEVQRGFELECWRRGFEIIIGGRQGAAGDTAINELAGRVDGLAIFPRRIEPSTLTHVARRIPVVEFASNGPIDTCSRIDVDNAGGIALLIDHLHSRHGHTAFQFVTSADNADSEVRRTAFAAEVSRLGLRAREPLAQTSELGSRIAALKDSEQLPDVFVCASDQLALETLDILQDLGLRVPDDIAVTGFDGILAGAIAQPRVTSVRQPMSEIGRVAADLLIARSAGEELENEAIVLPVRLLVRESCGCAP